MPTGTASKVTQLDDDMFGSEQPAAKQPPISLSHKNGHEASEEVVAEVAGAGDYSETQGYETGEETTEADEAANHSAVRNTPIPPRVEQDEEASEASANDSTFESVAGWEESSLTESDAAESEPVIEAFYASSESSEEFFPAIGAILAPIAKAVLPSLAGAVVQQGASRLNPRLQKIFQRLSRLGINPALLKRRETGEESDEAGVLDETTLATLEQQLETLEVVIGKDDRVQITNTKAVPWKRICHLKIQAANGKSYLGTGFFIGPRTIITAGHCVYIHGQGGWARSIVVTPARNGADAPFKSFTATSFRSVKGWVNNKSRNYDYGAIILPSNVTVPKEIGAFGFGTFSNQELKGKRLNTAGYPGDKPAGTMWFHGRTAKMILPRTITYDIDTAGGQSGSAVWVRRSDGQRIVVGIHTNGAASGNSATRITKPVFNNLKQWRAEGGNV